MMTFQLGDIVRRIEPFGLLIWAFVGAFLWLFWSALIELVLNVAK